jgi:hypothetical protein
VIANINSKPSKPIRDMLLRQAQLRMDYWYITLLRTQQNPQPDPIWDHIDRINSLTNEVKQQILQDLKS